MDSAFVLGVDILELKKVDAFYVRHRDKLASLLNPNELAYVKTSARPKDALALLLSAKEAVFKALGESFMGIAGFRDIRLFPQKNFSFQLKGHLKKSSVDVSRLKITFKKMRHHVVATCHHESLTPCAGI